MNAEVIPMNQSILTIRQGMRRTFSVVALLGIAGLLGLPTPLWSEATEQKVYGEILED